jgi:hypothetical protein
MGNEPLIIDILAQIDGVEFEAAWSRRVPSVLDSASGLIAPFISGPDLIASKLAAGRSQDLADVEAIHKAAKARERQTSK